MGQRSPKKAGESSHYQASEELYQALFEQAADGIFIADRQGHYIEVNQRGCEMLGYTREELVGLTIEDLIPVKDLTHDPLQMDALRTGSPLLKERRLRCKDGRILPVEISAKMLADGSFLGIVRDISKRKQAEIALRQAHQDYETLVNSVDGIVWEADAQTFHFIFVSQQAERLLGYPLERWLTEPTFWQDHIYPDDQEWAVQYCKKSTQEKRPHEFEYRMLAADGRVVWLHDVVTVVTEDEQPVRLRGIMLDITKRKEVEKKLRHTAEELRHVMASVSDYLWSGEIDEEGNWAYHYYSPVVETITGRPPEFYMEAPQHWLSTIYPDDQPSLLEAFQRVTSGQSQREEEEYRIIRPDGTIRWVRDCATATRLESNLLRIDGVVSDITERKQAEEELQKSHEELRVFFSQTIDGCFFMMLDEPVRWDETIDKEEVLDYVFAHQHITKINEAMLAQYGATREQMLKLTPHDFFQHNLAHGRELWRQLFDAGKVRLESDERKLDGTPMWIEGEYILLYDGEGQITGHFGIQRDMTKRRRGEEQLRESNERFRLLAESSLTGIYLIQDGLFHYVNPALAHVFGYTVEEVTDKLGPMDLVYPDDRPLVAGNIRRRIEGEEEAIHYDFRGLRKDGSMIYVEVHGRRIVYGGKTGVIGTLVDITERKLTEEALRTSEERLHLALDAAQMGLWSWDITTGEIVWSQKCLALYGLPPDTQMSYERFLQALHPEDRERIDAALRRAVEDRTGYDEQKRTVWPDGSVHWTASRGQVYYNAAGEPIRMTGVTFDISKWKEAEEEHQAHLWFLESLDRVNRAMQGTNDLEQMMSDVLDAVLTIFDCDRAWLIYPCDPEASSWQTLIEQTRPEYPGALALGVAVPMDPNAVRVFQAVRDASGPVKFGPGAKHPLSAEVSKQFNIQSQMAMAIYPKIDKPWMFGQHQCSYPRVWTPQEERLFQEIGRRLADALTSLLTYRNLRQSERRLAKAERMAHVGWWERDYDAHTITLSDEACRIFGLSSQEQHWHDLAQWHKRWLELVHPEDRPKMAQTVKEALQGGPRYDVEYRVIRPNGQVRFVRSQGDVTWEESGRPQRMFGIMQDITELRQVEDELRRNREAALQFSEQLATLQEVTNQLSKAESSDDLYRQAVQLGHSSLGFDRVSIWFIDEERGIMQGSFGTDEHGELRDERNAQVKFRHSGLAWRVFSHKESMALVEYGPLYNHLNQKVGEGDNAIAALWDGDDVIGVISVDNFFTNQSITEHPLEVLRLYATTLGHLITRKRAEEAERVSEARFRTFVDHATDAFFLHDEEGTILDVNRQACESLGYSREELIATSPFDFDVDTAPSTLNQMQAQLVAGEVFTLNTRHRRKDGSVFPVEVRIRPFRQGKRRLAVSLARDVTERKLAEKALRASEERYRTLYRDNPSMFFTLDSEGVIISVNTFGASQLGYTIGELEGQSVLKVFYAEDRTAVTTQLQRCIQNPGQTNYWQFRKVHKDGHLLWVEEFVRAITNPNGAIDILVVCQDITDRKQAEIERERLLAQIQEQAQQVQNIIDTVPEGVMLLNEDQFITLTNPAARQYLTLLAPEFQDGRLTQLGQRSLNELLTSPPKGLWHEIPTDDLVFETITRPVENGPHNGGWVLVLRDITQERVIQQRVQRQERLAAVGQLAAGIAHDFNNILAVIILYTQLISRTVEMPARIQERLHTIEQQIGRATDLIQQILDFSRQSILERKPFDLLPFMEELVVLLERTLPEHILIELDHAAEAYFIQADPSRIQQVMMNLAVNARDAMPEGGHLHISLAHVQTVEPRPMPVQDLPPGSWIQIKVTDSGGGIPPKVLTHIFEPFFTTKEIGEGTGLGLAQVYGIIQQHEGYIDVTTEEGQGTTFSLYFPALNTSGNMVNTQVNAVLQLGQLQRILVVEDNRTIRKALLDSLAELNYKVLAATNGREALTILATKATEVDLVLSDAVMPEMGGIALFHAMQEQKLTIPIVLLTGHPLSKEMENLRTLGLAGWLPKPPDLVNLSNLLAEVLAI